ncbi:16S rRNA (uracil(1498)-N(3))-methyltransferase [Terrimonas sp. NA20]|uniref:Ribosomal RNA small subunit methyltransferase E n=1 Tax=Terrimonas ginsenosidimutans TaxID=2908004 RepID=A0ABS9KVR5_9BACT|nr:RsmE family RNA methyltransferase [Terrimonas ginsenosidimutans]MCG2616432.1 16S rRNA (uracil(1498)-N(3))-methyltransferase [Terrimonas ginsenosidimutans]
MALPYFYLSTYSSSQKTIVLDEDTSRHVVQVLRMQNGEKLNLTDGKGHLITTTISDNHKKHCTVEVNTVQQTPAIERKTVIAISLLKNTNRFEWFLEKATELGVSEIVPVIGTRTEKEKFRHDRLQQILVSAMLQSQQSWLPVLHEPVGYDSLFTLGDVNNIPHKFIAHCDEQYKTPLVNELAAASGSRIILIGPEGDFTPDEIALALSNQFKPVMLGDTRLRAETAGVVAASLMCLV